MPTIKKRQLDVGILEPLRGRVSRSWLRKVASRALDEVLPGEACQLSLAVVDDETIRQLNRQYRGLDEVTDVLAFSPFYPGHWEGEGDPPTSGGLEGDMVLHPEGPKDLGEVVISYPQVTRQASSGPGGFESELALVVVHGLLHLMGFDHGDPMEQADMQAKERAILSGLV